MTNRDGGAVRLRLVATARTTDRDPTTPERAYGPANRLLTAAEVSQMLRAPRSTVYELARNRRISLLKVGPRNAVRSAAQAVDRAADRPPAVSIAKPRRRARRRRGAGWNASSAGTDILQMQGFRDAGGGTRTPDTRIMMGLNWDILGPKPSKHGRSRQVA